MKVRQVKLREIHKSATTSAGKPSFCSVVWDQQGFHSVTASSSDPSIAVHNALLLTCPPKLLRNHRDGVTAIAMSPNATCLASGSVDHSVKLYKFPGGEFETNITRFTLPSHSSTSFSPVSSLILSIRRSSLNRSNSEPPLKSSPSQTLLHSLSISIPSTYIFYYFWVCLWIHSQSSAFLVLFVINWCRGMGNRSTFDCSCFF